MIQPSACPPWQPDTGNPPYSGLPRPTLIHHALGHDPCEVARRVTIKPKLLDIAVRHLARLSSATRTNALVTASSPRCSREGPAAMLKRLMERSPA